MGHVPGAERWDLRVGSAHTCHFTHQNGTLVYTSSAWHMEFLPTVSHSERCQVGLSRPTRRVGSGAQKCEKSEAAKCRGVEIIIIVVDELLLLCQITRLSRNCSRISAGCLLFPHPNLFPLLCLGSPRRSPDPWLLVREWLLSGIGRRQAGGTGVKEGFPPSHSLTGA